MYRRWRCLPTGDGCACVRACVRACVCVEVRHRCSRRQRTLSIELSGASNTEMYLDSPPPPEYNHKNRKWTTAATVTPVSTLVMVQ